MSAPVPVVITSEAPVSPVVGTYASARARTRTGYSVGMAPPEIGRLRPVLSSGSTPLIRPWSPNTMLSPAPARITSAPAPPNTKSLPRPVVIRSAAPYASSVDQTWSRLYGLGSVKDTWSALVAVGVYWAT